MNPRELEKRYTLPTYDHVRFPLSLVRGEGNRVFDEEGKSYLDLYGGHAVCILGHCHPGWVEAVREQAGTLVFYSNTVYSPTRAQAARRLVEHSYDTMQGAYFCSSGAEANETALKIARKATGRALVISTESGFHGRTLGALSVTGYPKMRDAFPVNVADRTRFVPFGDLEAVKAIEPSEVAAVILEPVQSVAGVRTAGREFFTGLREHCREHGIALIFDEVQTGSGRTGEWFAGHHWGVSPDLVTTAKGLGGGIPVGAVIASREVAATVQPGDQATTFGGGPLAMAAVAATYRILEEEGLVERVRRESARVVDRLGEIAGVKDVRGLGYLLGVECEVPAKEVQRRLLDRGILVGTSGHAGTFRLLPPLTVETSEWDEFLGVLAEVLAGGS